MKYLPVVLGMILLLAVPGGLAFAQESVEDIETEIADREARIDQIQDQMEEYRDQINALSNKTAGLLNDIALIENQIAIADLNITTAQVQIETEQLQLKIIEKRIEEETARIDRQKEMMEELLFEMHKQSRIGLLEVIFGAESFNQLFSGVEMLTSVNGDLNQTYTATAASRRRLEEDRAEQEQRVEGLEELQDELEALVVRLESSQAAKDTLVTETQSSEAQYRVLMSELRQEQQYITSQVTSLQYELEQKLSENGGEDTSSYVAGTMSHPLPSGILTAYFHDPSYPFRHLFEHSGIDLAAPTGTPIQAAAPGIVAWTRTGRSYGNYAMIIHEGGFATLYAHMSAFGASTGEYVSRGQTIGYVGSTGFSTGPHLHFEVRLNGIPVNPYTYITE
jgi:murein DD-endopeptidase MepM/ murein hydrolase activator NlpD